MKAILNISLLALLVLSSCSSSLYTGAEYDDLYFSASDKPVVKARPSVREQVSDQNQNAGEYYDNIYAADTLVADEYSDAVDINDQIVENNIYDNGYDYYDNYSYTGRLRRFYGNYFDPYWRDPFYFDYGYGFPSYSLGMGYGGYPWSSGYYSPFYYDPYNYYDPFYNYSRYYGGYYGGYYGSYYGGLFGGYRGYYGGYGNYGGGYYARESRDYVPYGRTDRASNLSSRWNTNTGATGSGRRDSYLSTGSSSSTGGRVASDSRTIAKETGRTASPNTLSKPSYSQADRKAGQAQTGSESLRSNTISNQRSAATKPSYSDVNRSYTPSYNSPRMPTRPAYNNSRVSESMSSGTTNRSNSAVTNNRVNSNSGSSRTPVNQGTYQNFNNNSGSNSSVSGTQRRVDAPTGYSSPPTGTRSNVSTYRSTEGYSVPSRSSVQSRSSYSSGSYNNSSSGSRSSSYSGSSNYSSGSSSYSSGSSYSGSSSSGSSGSSSGSSSSSGGSSGSGSGRR